MQLCGAGWLAAAAVAAAGAALPTTRGAGRGPSLSALTRASLLSPVQQVRLRYEDRRAPVQAKLPPNYPGRHQRRGEQHLLMSSRAAS